MVTMLGLIEQLLYWQWINSVMDGIGFGLGALVIGMLYVRIIKLEARINELVR